MENQEEKDEKLMSDGEKVQDEKRKWKTKNWQISQKGKIFGLEPIRWGNKWKKIFSLRPRWENRNFRN